MKLPTFNAETHTYVMDGTTIPSVTQVLKRAGIIDYSAVDSVALSMARARGTAVHAAIAAGGINTTDPSIEGFLNAWRRFTGAVRFKVVHHERMVYSALHQYAGTFDVFGLMHNRPALIDVKTGSSPLWAGLQLAAYQLAGQECGVLPHNSLRFVVELTARGTFRLLEYTNRAGDTARFIAALYQSKNED
jgi:hypothetical protein